MPQFFSFVLIPGFNFKELYIQVGCIGFNELSKLCSGSVH